MQYRQAGVPESVLRRLRRREYRIEAEIDLHGMRLAEARVHLREFLLTSLARRLQCLRIVHGKGLRSGQRGPVIKNAVHSLLRRTEPVLATLARDGGTGARWCCCVPRRARALDLINQDRCHGGQTCCGPKPQVLGSRCL
jgi:DNA-nicking Smr family endonuclease